MSKKLLLLLILLISGLFTIFTIPACTSSMEADDYLLLETISAQSTRISHLSTQVARQELTNISQWESVGRLYTQMPYALGIITPLPHSITITPTPTPYPPGNQKPDSNETPTPTASLDIEYPPDMRTGIGRIDVVIDAILSEDINAKLDLVRFSTTACTFGDGLGGPQSCIGEEKDGTMVDVFPVSSGEGFFYRHDRIREIFNFSVHGLFAVYRVPEDVFQADYWPSGEYGLVFTSEDGGKPHIIIVLTENGQIVRLGFYYNWPPFEIVNEMSDEFILDPMR